MKQTLEECISNIQEFAKAHNVEFNQEGEVGFGRECVGLSKNNSYIDYCPINMTDYDEIPEYYHQELLEIAPADSYDKHNCMAVLGRGELAIRQLSEWVDKLKELNATIVQYNTGATGIQAMVTGRTHYTIQITK